MESSLGTQIKTSSKYTHRNQGGSACGKANGSLLQASPPNFPLLLLHNHLSVKAVPFLPAAILVMPVPALEFDSSAFTPKVQSRSR
jgi:hypothetical protein